MQNSRSHWSHREPVKISKWLLRMMIVLHVLCLMSLLTGCGSIADSIRAGSNDAVTGEPAR